MEEPTYLESQSFTVAPPPRRPKRPRWRIAIAALLAGSLVAGGLAATHAGQASPAVASATTNLASSLVSDDAGSATMARSGPRGGFGGPGLGFAGRLAAGLTVLGVSGNTITATARAGQTVTITVNSSTKYTRAGASITLGDIQKGDRIAVQGTRSSQTAITATAIQVVLPTEAGVVTAVSGNTITLSNFNSTSHTVNVSGSTTYTRAGQSASLSDITTGTGIVAEGTSNTDGSLNALSIVIQMPRVAGQVTAASNGTYTISGNSRTGTTTETVNTSGTTTYVDTAGTAVQPSAITNGTYIVTEGTLSADGKTMTALRITVLPAGRGGPGFMGGMGGGFGLGSLQSSGGAMSGTTTSGTIASGFGM